jgi:hypothetical protein
MRANRAGIVLHAVAIALPVLSLPGSAGEMKDIPHPYILWTKEEAADLRKRIETDATARRQYEQMEKDQGKAGQGLLNLFKYSVLGDKAAGEAEKKALLRFIGARPPPNKPGDPATGNAAYRDDRTMDVLRFDVLYDELSEDERAGERRHSGQYADPARGRR